MPVTEKILNKIIILITTIFIFIYYFSIPVNSLNINQANDFLFYQEQAFDILDIVFFYSIYDLKNNDKWEIGESLEIPPYPTNVKFCTDYKCYNIEGTPHSRMQQNCWTDEFGCRRFNDDYCIGMGSYYTTLIGDRFEITLDTNITFTVIIGDQKADTDTDWTNMYTPCINYDGEYCANVLEFIIDDEVVTNEMYSYGSLDYYEFFKGNISKIVYLGRDNSQDWDLFE